MSTPQQNPDTVFNRRSPRDLLMLFAPALLITVIGFFVAFQFVEPEPPRHITMAAGPAEGAYYRTALRYQEILAREGIELELLETAGSEENLQLLQLPDGPVELAFLQGGAGLKKKPRGIESIGSVFFEPIWLFWRAKAPDQVALLHGKRIAAGEEGSGTRGAMSYLFKANGLDASEVEPVPLSGSDAAQALLSGEVDVAAFVSVYDNAYIQELLLADDIALMHFDRGEAYQRRFRFLSRVSLPRGFASLERDLPRADVPLIATVANLVIRDSLHPALIALVSSAAKEIHSDGDLFSLPHQFPSVENVVLPLNEDARRYITKGPPLLQRYLPFWLAIAIDRLIVLMIPLVTLLYPLFKILPPTYRWRIRKRIYRYYRALLDIDTTLSNHPDEQQVERCRKRLKVIEGELDTLSVPISYADNLYNLKMHLKLVSARLEQLTSNIPAR
jgi:TRAP transporter TAXI family solute receptor